MFYLSIKERDVRNLIAIIFALISSLPSQGQVKSSIIPKDKRPAYEWYLQQEGLPDLRQSRDSLHFRFSTGTQDIDIWTNDYKTFHGTFANNTTSEPCTDCLIKEKTKFYYLRSDLDTAKARMIYGLFDKLSVFNIPTMDSIKGWQYGCDGEIFTIELATHGHYSIKKYWSPDAYKETIKEAAAMDSLAHQLRTKLDMYASFDTFIDLLPSGCYYYGGFFVACRNTWPDFIMW